jgi:hypothetical protein
MRGLEEGEPLAGERVLDGLAGTDHLSSLVIGIA